MEQYEQFIQLVNNSIGIQDNQVLRKEAEDAFTLLRQQNPNLFIQLCLKIFESNKKKISHPSLFCTIYSFLFSLSLKNIKIIISS